MNKHIKIIIAAQMIFLIIVASVLYFFYPKTNLNIGGNLVSFNSINANVIVLSENLDFSNPRYIDFERRKSISFALESGTYYWKASNSLIESLKNKFTIDSEVGMRIDREKDNESELVNIGNVKINVTKTKSGTMLGHIILQPNESEKIEDEADDKYIGRQNENK